MPQKFQPIVLVHGGFAEVGGGNADARLRGVKIAARNGYAALLKSGNVLDAVETAISVMEYDPNFNAGYGAVLNLDGKVELDAAIMDGAHLDAGCVAAVQHIRHPIQLARKVMQETSHVYLAGQGATSFAAKAGMEILPEGALVIPKALNALEQYKKGGFKSFPNIYGKTGTVGAVAMDEYGNVAAGTSTGGLTGKMPGRIGDSSVLGAGTYADNAAGAVSSTGVGEIVMRYNMASRILANIAKDGMTAQESVEKEISAIKALFDDLGGAICIDKNGTIGIYSTAPMMVWAYQRGDEERHDFTKTPDNFKNAAESDGNGSGIQ